MMLYFCTNRKFSVYRMVVVTVAVVVLDIATGQSIQGDGGNEGCGSNSKDRSVVIVTMVIVVGSDNGTNTKFLKFGVCSGCPINGQGLMLMFFHANR